MPANKNASYRYRLIDTCLRQRGKEWTMELLQEYISQKLYEEFDVESGIGPRTLAEDIALMRKAPPQWYSAPIVRKDKKVFYSDKNYSINQHPLIEPDIEKLEEAEALLRQFPEIPLYEELQTMILKLKGVVQSNNKAIQPIIEFEKNANLKGLDFVRSFYNHILHQRVLQLIYQPYTWNKPLILKIHPYLLKEYNNRWFLLAYNEAEKKIWNFALDRIQDCTVKRGKYLPCAIDLTEHFKYVIGVTIPDDATPQEIHLKISSNRAPYVLTKPIHWTQQVLKKYKNGSVLLSLTLISNLELRSLLLGFGSDVKIIKPNNIAIDIQQELQKAIHLY